MTRAIVVTSIVFFGGAAMLALGSVLLMLRMPVSSSWLLLSAAALLLASGMIVLGRMRDQGDKLAQRTSAVRLLEEQIAQHRNAVDTLADGLDVALFICDSKANVLYANLKAIELFRVESPIGRNLLAITLSYDLEQLVLEAARLHTAHNAEMHFTYPEDRVGLAKAWPQEDGQRVFLSIYDISDLRKLERVRRDFVSNVSHELRTPLMIIRSMAETMLDEPVQHEKAGKYLEKVISEVDRLSAMSNDLLVLSTAESSYVEKQQTDIAELFRSTVSQLAPKAAERGLELTYEGPAALRIQANPEQLRQVALNLVDNAINYTNKGSVTVTVRQEDSEAEVRVRDTGIGIASEDLPRIFERFYRVDKARSRNIGGTGLGLSIVKHIIEAHGGRVSVQSALNEGSVFAVRLPKGVASSTG